MSLFNVFATAGSALAAQDVRLNTTASNLANADSVSSSTGETYRARHPVFGQMLDEFSEDGASVGVRVLGIVQSQAPLRREFSPEHPKADEQGYVFKPNVNVVEEMANMISASRSYQTNVEVLNTAKQMLLRTLALGQ
jgi:flagellar basal-body rod protein FlgC